MIFPFKKILCGISSFNKSVIPQTVLMVTFISILNRCSVCRNQGQVFLFVCFFPFACSPWILSITAYADQTADGFLLIGEIQLWMDFSQLLPTKFCTFIIQFGCKRLIWSFRKRKTKKAERMCASTYSFFHTSSCNLSSISINRRYGSLCESYIQHIESKRKSDVQRSMQNSLTRETSL